MTRDTSMVTNIPPAEAQSRDCTACGLTGASKLLTIWTAFDRKHMNFKWECERCHGREWEKFVAARNEPETLKCPRCGDKAPELITFQHTNLYIEKFCIRCMNEVHSGDDPWFTPDGHQRTIRYPGSDRLQAIVTKLMTPAGDRLDAAIAALNATNDPPMPQVTEPAKRAGGSSLCALCIQHSTRLLFVEGLWVCPGCKGLVGELPAEIDLQSWMRQPGE